MEHTSSLPSFELCMPPVHTEDNLYVWQLMIKKIGDLIKKYDPYIHSAYKKGFIELSLNEKEIPTLDVINQKLSSIGWKAVYVDGFVSAKTYVQLQANQIFPVSKNVRKIKHFYHSAAPDFCHDVLGHLPMLFSQDYRNLLSRWALEASKLSASKLDEALYKATVDLIEAREEDIPDNARIEKCTEQLDRVYAYLNSSPSLLSLLSKFYAWSFEFGILQEEGQPKIIGAAILSSSQEIENICTSKAVFRKLDVNTMFSNVNYTILQDTFYYVNSFSEYDDLLDGIEGYFQSKISQGLRSS